MLDKFLCASTRRRLAEFIWIDEGLQVASSDKEAMKNSGGVLGTSDTMVPKLLYEYGQHIIELCLWVAGGLGVAPTRLEAWSEELVYDSPEH